MTFVISRNGKSVDLDRVQLPDGRPARNLSREELYSELEAMGIQGLEVGAGRDGMVELLHKHNMMWGTAPGPTVMIRHKA